MLLYNSLTKKKEVFNTVNNIVKIYSCGPTVYSYAHIGNFSSFLMADLLVRYLRYKGYQVQWVQNITDVGHLTNDSDDGQDKMEQASQKEDKSVYEIARFYENAFLEDASLLKISKADHYPRATEHIDEMLAMIKLLVDKGYAYETEDGVYFDIDKFPSYGKLSGNKLEDLISGSRISIDDKKHNPYDFALWKKLVNENKNHIMYWDSPFGKGFPGWHIECSAMARKYLGDNIDIHTGGEDNKFPHHESEIAQTEAITGKCFVNYWMHKSRVSIDNKKMSKSLGNFYTVKDLFSKGFDAEIIRYFFLTVHYRKKLNFSFDGLDKARLSVKKINKIVWELEDLLKSKKDFSSENKLDDLVHDASSNFEKEMDNDLNVSAALAVVFTLIKNIRKIINKDNCSKHDILNCLIFFKGFDSIFGFMYEKRDEDSSLGEKFADEIKNLISKRQELRKAKCYAEADAIRDKLLKLGVKIAD